MITTKFLVVGAGPHSLAFVTRLLHFNRGSEFDNVSESDFQWISRLETTLHIEREKDFTFTKDEVVVIDPSGMK
jgi:hypothetical protein